MEPKDTTWYVGPPGGFIALPDLENATRNRQLMQAVSQGATGARTVNTTGMRRTWELTIEGLTRTAQGLLQNIHMGIIAGPLYLIDPLVVNHLSPRASSGLSAFGFEDALVSTAVGVGVNPVVTDSTFPLSPRHGFVAEIENTSGATAGVVLDGWLPLLPDKAYTVSVYMTAGATVTLAAKSRTSAGAESTITSSTQATTGSWVRKVLGFTVPADSVSVQLSMTIANGQSFVVGPAQLERGGVSDWVPGEGVPAVEITDMPEDLPYWYYTNSKLTLVEL